MNRPNTRMGTSYEMAQKLELETLISFLDGPFLIDCSGGWDMGHLILKACNPHAQLTSGLAVG